MKGIVYSLNNMHIKNLIERMKADLLLPNGKLKLLPSRHYAKYARHEIKIFCHVTARYSLPTIEVVDLLKSIIEGRSAIEIGAGYGDLGYHLNIPITDSKLQCRPDIKAYYEALRQPTIQYPDDVGELEALEAVDKYKPKVVVASWVTQWVDPDEPFVRQGSVYGIKESLLLNLVDTYILIGNEDIHGQKIILDTPHIKIKNPHVISRARCPEKDCIFIWRKADI